MQEYKRQIQNRIGEQIMTLQIIKLNSRAFLTVNDETIAEVLKYKASSSVNGSTELEMSLILPNGFQLEINELSL